MGCDLQCLLALIELLWLLKYHQKHLYSKLPDYVLEQSSQKWNSLVAEYSASTIKLVDDVLCNKQVRADSLALHEDILADPNERFLKDEQYLSAKGRPADHGFGHFVDVPESKLKSTVGFSIFAAGQKS